MVRKNRGIYGILCTSWVLINNLFADNLVGLDFLYCIAYFPIQNPTKNYFAVGKKWPKCRFLTCFFSRVGLASGWGVRRFHDNIHMFSNPT